MHNHIRALHEGILQRRRRKRRVNSEVATILIRLLPVVREIARLPRGIQRRLHVDNIAFSQPCRCPTRLVVQGYFFESPELDADVYDAVAAMVAVADDYGVRTEVCEEGVKGRQAGRVGQDMPVEEGGEDRFETGCVWASEA